MKRKIVILLCLVTILVGSLSYILLKTFYESPVKDTDSTVTNNEVINNDEEKKPSNGPYINKDNLDYNTKSDSIGFYETEEGLTSVYLLQKTPNDDKGIYYYILSNYSFSSEVERLNITLNQAKDIVLERLPDDISEDKRIYDSSSGSTYIFYKSSSGNFVASLKHSIISTTNGIANYDKERIAGISFLKKWE
ncbi:MAG: hypothetical protein GX275_09010 [Clostridiales bacterium]|nr:hypothetical protein [Clostridiales bacterium]